MWLAALSGRLAYVAHRACDHAVAWYGPWRTRSRGAGDIPADHWGQTQPGRTSLFDTLQQVLRLAAQCPAGPVGDDIRRAACELVEANSRAARHAGRRRLMKVIAAVEQRYARGRSRRDDPSRSTARQLTAALGAEFGSG